MKTAELKNFNPPWLIKGSVQLITTGSFAGLDIVKPASDFPLVVTTCKTTDCLLIKLIGNPLKYKNIKENILLGFFLETNGELVMNIPVSTICSIRLRRSEVSKLRMDDKKEVYVVKNQRVLKR